MDKTKTVSKPGSAGAQQPSGIPLTKKRPANEGAPQVPKLPAGRLKKPNILLMQLLSENDEPATSSSIVAGKKPVPPEQQEKEPKASLPSSPSKPLNVSKKQAAPLGNHNSNIVVTKKSSADNFKLKDKQPRQEIDQCHDIDQGQEVHQSLEIDQHEEVDQREEVDPSQEVNEHEEVDPSQEVDENEEVNPNQEVDQSSELFEDDQDYEKRSDAEQDDQENLLQVGRIELEEAKSSETKNSDYFPSMAGHQDHYFELMQGPQNQVICSRFGLTIRRCDIITLHEEKRLNDAVMNYYLNLIQLRSEQRSEELASVYSFSTFFLTRLVQSGQSGVKRWTKKDDIFSKDIILVPVILSGLWSMVIIDMRCKSIGYYTSMEHPHQKVLDALVVYLREESLDKRQVTFDADEFDIGTVADLPQQDNNTDSGVFSCMFAEYVTRDAPITFNQEHIDYFRRRMALEIAGGKLWR